MAKYFLRYCSGVFRIAYSPYRPRWADLRTISLMSVARISSRQPGDRIPLLGRHHRERIRPSPVEQAALQILRAFDAPCPVLL